MMVKNVSFVVFVTISWPSAILPEETCIRYCNECEMRVSHLDVDVVFGLEDEVQVSVVDGGLYMLDPCRPLTRATHDLGAEEDYIYTCTHYDLKIITPI